MRILFLDIDGVLNSLASAVTIGLSHPFSDPEKVILDPVAVGLLKEICETCDLHIYIHSTWGRLRKPGWFRAVFRKYEFDASVLDALPHAEKRNDRIKDALNRYEPDDFIILDDDTVCEAFGENFIHISSKNGLGWEHYERILARFRKEVPVILM